MKLSTEAVRPLLSLLCTHQMGSEAKPGHPTAVEWISPNERNAATLPVTRSMRHLFKSRRLRFIYIIYLKKKEKEKKEKKQNKKETHHPNGTNDPTTSSEFSPKPRAPHIWMDSRCPASGNACATWLEAPDVCPVRVVGSHSHGFDGPFGGVRPQAPNPSGVDGRSCASMLVAECKIPFQNNIHYSGVLKLEGQLCRKYHRRTLWP